MSSKLEKIDDTGTKVIDNSPMTREQGAIQPNTIAASTAVVGISFVVAALAFFSYGGLFLAMFFWITMVSAWYYGVLYLGRKDQDNLAWRMVRTREKKVLKRQEKKALLPKNHV